MDASCMQLHHMCTVCHPANSSWSAFAHQHMRRDNRKAGQSLDIIERLKRRAGTAVAPCKVFVVSQVSPGILHTAEARLTRSCMHTAM